MPSTVWVRIGGSVAGSVGFAVVRARVVVEISLDISSALTEFENCSEPNNFTLYDETLMNTLIFSGISV